MYRIPREEISLFKTLDSNPTYGELTKNGVKRLINLIPKCKRKVFCDLGSGYGTLLKYINELNNDFIEIIGIELSKDRYDKSIELFKKIKNKKRLRLLEGNLLDLDISKMDVLYVSNLCFNHTFNNVLSSKINNDVKNGSIVFASQRLKLDREYYLKEIVVEQSWDKKSLLFKYEIF